MGPEISNSNPLFQYSDTLFIRTGDTGSRIATFRSVTGAPISTYASHDFEGSPRMGLKPRRLILTGHTVSPNLIPPIHKLNHSLGWYCSNLGHCKGSRRISKISRAI